MSTSRTLNKARWMITFAKIVECGGISAAARALEQDKAATSRQLRDLERHMGIRLLNRSTTHISLTDVGRAVYERASRIVHELDGAQADAEHFLAMPSGVLTVSTSVAFGKLHVAPLLPAFMKVYPNVAVELCLLDRHVDLVEEGFDVLLRLCDEPPQSLAAQRVCDLSYALVASADLLAKGPAIEHPQDLARHNCLFYGFKTRETVWRLAKGPTRFEVKVSNNLSVNSSEAVRELARASLGVALLPRFAIADDLRSNALHSVLPEYEVSGSLGRFLYVVHMPGRYLPPKTRAFMDFLKSRWSPSAPWEVRADDAQTASSYPSVGSIEAAPTSRPRTEPRAARASAVGDP